MTCPYLDSNCRQDPAPGAESCPSCGRFWKSCEGCGTANRAFANHCRACGAAIDAADGNWLAYKGSAQRLGFNPARNAQSVQPFTPVPAKLTLSLGDPCRSLLGYDRHLIAIAQNGTIEVADPLGAAASRVRFQVTGPITCEPCISGGVLYVGSPRQIAAYSLGALTVPSPQFRPLWQVTVPGNPIQALTVVGARLYATVAASEARRDVMAIDTRDRGRSGARVIHSGMNISWLAGDPAAAMLVFLSEHRGQVALYTITAAGVETHPLPFDELSDQPIALAGGKVFAIFGRDRRLVQIDARTGAVDEHLQEDVQMFALTRDGGGWDRDGVNIHTGKVRFGRSNSFDTFPPLDRVVKGSPLVIQRRAAVVGMSNGRVRVYDLLRPPAYGIWGLDGESGAPITALASFGPYVAAGNSHGVVEVLELQSQKVDG